MFHKSIYLKSLSVSFAHKICFENFSAEIRHGNRIGIIGRNGSGKSSLLKILLGINEPSEGSIHGLSEIKIGYVPQIIETSYALSGGQQFNKALIEALTNEPDLLILDEPTNHLDQQNRQMLMRLLQSYSGTLIIVSHDKELLCKYILTLWHIDDGKIKLFTGNYNHYIHELSLKRTSIKVKLSQIENQKKEMHQKLMKENQNTAKSICQGKKKAVSNKWTKMAKGLKISKAEKTQGKQLKFIKDLKQTLVSELKHLRLPEIIEPKFSISAQNINKRTILQINNGKIAYAQNKWILSNISFLMIGSGRIALMGKNGSGKSTLLKAILRYPNVVREGYWFLPKRDDIGYLDQHYSTLSPNKSVLETISDINIRLSQAEIRRHLNDFLFRKNEEVTALVRTLSGGEKARLSLAQIAVHTPKLLILDEITNNLDLESKSHIVQVLKAYPGAMIVISHDANFLESIGINEIVNVRNFEFSGFVA